MRHTLRYTVLLLGIGMTLAIGWPAGVQGLTQQAVGFYMAGIGKGTLGPVAPPAAKAVKPQVRGYFKEVIKKQGGPPVKAPFYEERILIEGGNTRGEVRGDIQ